MEKNGFRVVTKVLDDMTPIKAKYSIPANLQSCHTAIVNGYVVEGHVPVAEIKRMLAERPDIVGIAVPGMPAGSPGMEGAGGTPGPFDVIAFSKDGKTEVYASYP